MNFTGLPFPFFANPVSAGGYNSTMTLEEGLLIPAAVLAAYGLAMVVSHEGKRWFEFSWFFCAFWLTLPWLFRNHAVPFWAKLLYWIPVAGTAGLVFWINDQNRALSRKGAKQDCSVIIILGCELYSLAFNNRENTAYSYLMMHPQAKGICSGGKGKDEEKSEGAGFYDNLRRRGISEARLCVEDQSFSTSENLRNSQKLMEDPDMQAGIVTSQYHIYRSILIARKAGYKNPAGIGAPTVLFYQPNYLLREAAALVYGKLRGTL